jgi:hypothetical protein
MTRYRHVLVLFLRQHELSVRIESPLKNEGGLLLRAPPPRLRQRTYVVRKLRRSANS